MITVETHLSFPSWSCLANKHHWPTGAQLVGTLALLFLILHAEQIHRSYCWIIALLWPSSLLLVYSPVSFHPVLIADIFLAVQTFCCVYGCVILEELHHQRQQVAKAELRKNQERTRRERGESGTIPRLSVPQFGCVIDLGLYCQPKSFSIPLSAQHIVVLLIFFCYFADVAVVSLSAAAWIRAKTHRRETTSDWKVEFLEFWILVFSKLISSSVISHAFGMWALVDSFFIADTHFSAKLQALSLLFHALLSGRPMV